MLSLIICSRTPKISNKLEENIAETIGCKYELVVIDNSRNKYSIFSAYNEGVRQAKGDILCFMHDDILYKTQDWGKKVLSYFFEENVGCIGIAGTMFLPRIPASWFSMKDEIINIIQHYKTGDDGVLVNQGFSDKACRVVAVDGVWMCFPRSVFSRIQFDEKYGGYHAYDTDICMQVNSLKKNILVAPDILIEHFSCGTLSKDLFNANLLFYDKWKNNLPVYVPDYCQTRERKVNLWWYFWTFVSQMDSYLYEYKAIRKYIRTIVWKMPIVVNGAALKIARFYVKSLLCKRKN